MVAGGKFTLDPKYTRYPTIIHAIEANARRAPDRIALIVGERQLNNTQYRAAIGGMAQHLQSLGAKGRAVAVCMGNGMEAAVALLGAMAAGALAAPVNPNYTQAELRPMLKDVGPHIVCCDPALADRVRALAAELGIVHVVVMGAGALTIDAWAATPDLGLPAPLPAPGDPSVMFFTGGTTGIPKGAEHTHATLMAYVCATVAIWPLPIDEERILSVAPLFHIWGFCFALVYPVFMGCTTVLAPVYKPADLLASIERHRITIFAGGPPAMYVGLRANENYRRTDFSSLRWCLSGGAPCPEELLRAWEAETGAAILEGIGMSEGAPICSMPMTGARKIRSVGVVMPDSEVETVDLDTGTRVTAVGEPGEIRVRGPQFIKAYRNRPEETAKAIRDGWLYTGDIGYFDEDGYLFIVDRKKEMILVGGYNVYPREIDELLTNHPAVIEAATIGVPDSFSGESVKAYVALKPGAAVTREELDAYCKRNLVKYKQPKAIEILDTLPKTSVGKINKLMLKAKG